MSDILLSVIAMLLLALLCWIPCGSAENEPAVPSNSQIGDPGLGSSYAGDYFGVYYPVKSSAKKNGYGRIGPYRETVCQKLRACLQVYPTKESYPTVLIAIGKDGKVKEADIMLSSRFRLIDQRFLSQIKLLQFDCLPSWFKITEIHIKCDFKKYEESTTSNVSQESKHHE